MTPAIRLTDEERAEVRKKLFEEKKADWLFIAEAISEASQISAAMIRMAMKNGDASLLLDAMNAAIDIYCERSGEYERAEQKVLSSKSINGARYLQA